MNQINKTTNAIFLDFIIFLIFFNNILQYKIFTLHLRFFKAE